jgi:hypothetical protein
MIAFQRVEVEPAVPEPIPEQQAVPASAVVVLPPIPKGPIDPLLGEPGIRSEYRFQLYVAAMEKTDVEVRVMTATDEMAIRKAINRAGKKPWVCKTVDNNGRAITHFRLRKAGETANPFWQFTNTDPTTARKEMESRVMRGKWRGLAESAVLHGHVDIEGTRQDAETLWRTLKKMALTYVRGTIRPKPRESYFIEDLGNSIWRVSVAPNARSILHMGLLMRAREESAEADDIDDPDTGGESP